MLRCDIHVGIYYLPLLAQRLPLQLVDVIQRVPPWLWHEACCNTSAEQIAAVIPMVPDLDMVKNAHQLEGVATIAKFNFDERKKEGIPSLSTAGWCALCKVIAQNAENDVQGYCSRVITTCDKLSSLQERGV